MKFGVEGGSVANSELSVAARLNNRGVLHRAKSRPDADLSDAVVRYKSLQTATDRPNAAVRHTEGRVLSSSHPRAQNQHRAS